MDYQKLVEELKLDPEGLGYEAMLLSGSHNLIEEVINAKRFLMPGLVGIDTALIWMATHGILPKLRVASTSSNQDVAAIAEIAILLVQNPNISKIDFGIPEVQTMFGVLVSAGVISSLERDEIFNKSLVYRSRCDVLQLPYVSAQDIANIAQDVLNG